MNAGRIAILIVVALALTPHIFGAGPLQYYSVTPCRVLDTRDSVGPNGGLTLSSGFRADPAGLLRIDSSTSTREPGSGSASLRGRCATHCFHRPIETVA